MAFSVNPNLTKPTYSIIMLVFHRDKKLVQMARDCVATVKSFSSDYELIIVDNGSTVRYDWEKECDTYIRVNSNWGISHGWNLGIKASRGQYLTIIGDDICARKGWLECMKVGADMPHSGMCNPQIEHLPGGMGCVENYKWPSGACFMLPRKTIEKVGYFDEDTYFPCNYEDWDYWIRIYRAGLKIYTNYQGPTILHKEGQTLHATDLSEKNEVTKKAFFNKWRFDPVPVFCGKQDIQEVLTCKPHLNIPNV